MKNAEGMQRPNHLQMKAMIDKLRAKFEKEFTKNDHAAVRELKKIISDAQVGEFLTIAKEIRETKLEAFESQRQIARRSGGTSSGRGRF